MQDETAAQDEVSLRDYLDLLRRRSAIIIQTVVAALVIGIVVAVVSTNVYSSGGRLLIQPTVSVATNTMQSANDPINTISTQGQVHNIETQLEVLMNTDLISDAYKASGTSGEGVHPNVGRRSEDIDIIDVSVEAPKPEVARDVAENMMDLYMKYEAKSRTGDLDAAIGYATKQLNESNAALKDNTQKLQAFEAAHNIPDYAAREAALASQLASQEAESGKIKAEIAGTQKFIDATKLNLAKTPNNLTTYDVVTNPSIESMRNKIFDLEVERDTKSTIFKPEHPTMKALDRQIKKQRAEMAAVARTVKTSRVSTNPLIEAGREKLRDYDATMAKLNESLRQTDALASRSRSEQLALSKGATTSATYRQQIAFYQSQITTAETTLSSLQLRQKAQPHGIQA